MGSQQQGPSAKTKTLVSIFKSSRKDEMYLYVAKSHGLKSVPGNLLELFGKPLPVFDLLLTSEKTLARASGSDVLNSIQDQGYYLQMPPAADEVPDLVKLREAMPAKRRPQQN